MLFVSGDQSSSPSSLQVALASSKESPSPKKSALKLAEGLCVSGQHSRQHFGCVWGKTCPLRLTLKIIVSKDCDVCLQALWRRCARGSCS